MTQEEILKKRAELKVKLQEIDQEMDKELMRKQQAMKSIGKIKEGRLFKKSELDDFYYVRGKYNRNLGHFSCVAFRCKNHERFSWTDRGFAKETMVHPYSPETDTREYRI